MIQSDKQKNDIGAQTYRRDIQQCTEIPAESFRYLLKYDQRGVSWSDKEGIDLTVGYIPKGKI